MVYYSLWFQLFTTTNLGLTFFYLSYWSSYDTCTMIFPPKARLKPSNNAVVLVLTTRGSPSPLVQVELALSSVVHFPKHKLIERIIPNDSHRCYFGLCTFVHYEALAEPWNDSQIVQLHDGF